MEPTIESPIQRLWSILQRKIALLELIELSILSVAFWYLLLILPPQKLNGDLANQLDLLHGMVLIVLGSWLLYNLYIFLARIGGRKVDVAIWIIASLLTATYTFWAWSILDLNRWIMAKLLYRGEAPVEYAWSAQSKLLHKVWLEAHKVPAKPRMG